MKIYPRNTRKTLPVIFLLLIGILAPGIQAAKSRVNPVAVTVAFGDKFYRTELYCGRSKPGGGMVTEAEWEQFLADEVTPRFPDGFTILEAKGQYREKSGKIITEPSEVLVFLYTKKTREESRRKIEEIRAAYVKRFSQESVLRLDFRQPVEASF